MAILAVVFAFVGCDEEFTEVGGEIINNPSNVELREIEVNAYSQKIDSVQTNNLANYILGVNNHPVFGESVASIVTQVNLSSADPDFGENVMLDSVVMTIPYFATEIAGGTDEEITYDLDSIYGNESFKLSVFETSFFLNDLDPDAGFEQSQKYYSYQQDVIEQNILGEPLYVDDNFKPSSQSITSYEIDGVGENDTIVNSPALRVKLPLDYFKQKIIERAGSDVLLNNSNFRDYFRSLFIKAEPNGTGGSQILLDFSGQNQQAKISLYYTSDVQSGDETVNRRGSYDLSLAGNRFNTFEGEFPENVTQIINSQSEETGSENIYLKAQEGSVAVINIFPDAEVLQNLRDEELLVNEADLTFYVNDDLIEGGDQPRRLYLYDLENNTILADYALDVTFNATSPDLSLTRFSGIQTEDDENGTFYTIRITNHVSSIINEDAENVKLGLVIVPNINSVVARSQQGGIIGSVMSATRNVPMIDRIPAVNSLTPAGTVLHGNLSEDEDKRLKLQIYYTNFN